MRFQTAKEIGLECGLETPAEWINNIALHALNLFSYSEIDGHMHELREDAKRNGVRFSNVCGDAVLEGDSDTEICYVCRKIRDALKPSGGD